MTSYYHIRTLKNIETNLQKLEFLQKWVFTHKIK